ncbi:helix-turn-helix domain-containing protein [Sneathiella chinensis]|uniref:DNA-binding protein n=1 Tax=Sneathiella chinensis TaxID=349750 RepID=A0ABQ5U4D8_9PROT|nr:XRE family transcriptional regulator [Sneathiella chinensis]GLQ06713.1 DNA-binding protein [Sneathiella chinensis]
MTQNALTPPSVGKTINRLRKEKQLTLDQLASLCGVSKSMLSQIERNETNPTLAIVWRLAEALGQTIDDLIRGEEAEHSLIIEGGSSIPVLHDPDGHYTLTVLGPAELVNNTEWYQLNIEPGGRVNSQPHAPRTMEHLTVLDGELYVLSGDESGIVKKGETARYAADRPHSIENRSGENARALLVVILGT